MRVRKHRSKGRETKDYYVFFTDHKGRRERKIPACPDKRKSEELGRRVSALVECRSLGVAFSPDLTQWLQSVSADLRRRLVALDLIDAAWAARDGQIEEHLESFRDYLTGEKVEVEGGRVPTTEYIDLMMGRLRLCVRLGRWTTATDITPDSMRKCLDLLRQGGIESDRKGKCRKLRPASWQTCNHYLTHVKGFCEWMVSVGRLPRNPLVNMKKANLKGKLVHDRAYLTVEQADALLQATKNGPVRFGMTGYERYLIYRLTLEAALRADDVRELRVGMFDFGSNRIRGEGKGRKQFDLPLRESTCAEIRAFCATKLPAVQVFGGTYRRLTTKTSRMLKADLADAGIPDKTPDGKILDFHALRHTCATWLGHLGAPLIHIKAVMRHEDARTTMRYVEATEGGVQRAIDLLPDLGKRAIG